MGNSPLLIACKSGNLEAVKYFADEKGCNLKRSNILGEYSVSLAVNSCNFELIIVSILTSNSYN